MNSNYTQEEERSWYSTVDGSAIDIGLYQDNLSPTAPVEWEPEQQEFDKELFIEAVRAHACIWDVNASSYKDRGTEQNAWNILGKIFGQDGKIHV